MGSPAELLLASGYKARRDQRPSDAKQHFADAIELCQKEGDRSGLAEALAGLGQIERDLHDDADARRHYEESVAVCRTLDDPLKLAHTVRHLGDILSQQGEHVLAEPCFIEAIDIYRAHDDCSPLDLANAIRGFALLKTQGKETRDALLLWREARNLYERCKIEAGVRESDRQLSLLAQ
jgi:tetratricopeptide (TPR) repeat protein